MEIKRAATIEYRPSVMADSEYKMTRLVQNTGANSVTISGSQSTATIEIPAVCMNLAKSYLNFTITVPAAADATHYSQCYRDTPPIARAELFTRGGKYLMDISNFSNIYQAFGQRTKKIEPFHGSDSGIVAKTALNDLTVRKLVSVAGNAPAVVNFKIPGSELFNTVMSLDKSIYLGEVLQLRLTFLEKDAIGFSSENENGLPTDPGNPANPLTALPVTAPGAITLTDFNYFLAQEVNPRVVDDLIRTVSTTGMSVVIPFVHSYKTVATAAESAVSIRLSRGHGQSVERIYSIPVTGMQVRQVTTDALYGAEQWGGRYSADASLLTSFYSLLDSRRLQEFDVLCGTTKDYSWLREHEKKDRVVSLSEDLNDTKNFAWSDSWCADLECAINQHVGGLDLSVERKYDVYFRATPANIKYYTAVVCQKMLSMGPAGVDVM